MSRARLCLATLFGASLLGWAFSCGSISQDFQLCGQIAEDGCPVGRGGTCDDAECAALYDCVEGAWTRVKVCEGFHATGGGGAGGSGGAGAGGSCDPIELDHTGETAGCKPDLQNPDCPLVAAEACAASACLVDCLDFYLCTAQGWQLGAFCTEEGELIVAP